MSRPDPDFMGFGVTASGQIPPRETPRRTQVSIVTKNGGPNLRLPFCPCRLPISEW